MDRIFYSLFVGVAAIASLESRPESEAKVECAIHFVMAQQILTDATVTMHGHITLVQTSRRHQHKSSILV